MSHISFSEFKIWNECPYKHKLQYKDKLKGFTGNLYTAFGSAIHSACEEYAKGGFASESKDVFISSFLEEVGDLSEEIQEQITQKDGEAFLEQGLEILPEICPAVHENFSGCEVVSVEEALFEPVKEFVENEYSFKGFIDLVLKTPDGKYHIIDWKSCSWGWDARRRSDPMATYQLIFYKHYYALKHGIDVKSINTHFALLKRTAKTGAKVEIFKVTSGARRTENALKMLKNALYNINKSRFIKKRTSCNRCEFYKTEHCT